MACTCGRLSNQTRHSRERDGRGQAELEAAGARKQLYLGSAPRRRMAGARGSQHGCCARRHRSGAARRSTSCWEQRWRRNWRVCTMTLALTGWPRTPPRRPATTLAPLRLDRKHNWRFRATPARVVKKRTKDVFVCHLILHTSDQVSRKCPLGRFPLVPKGIEVVGWPKSKTPNGRSQEKGLFVRFLFEGCRDCFCHTFGTPTSVKPSSLQSLPSVDVVKTTPNCVQRPKTSSDSSSQHNHALALARVVLHSMHVEGDKRIVPLRTRGK